MIQTNYSIEDIKWMIKTAHDNTVEILSLADYAKSAIEGYDAFKHGGAVVDSEELTASLEKIEEDKASAIESYETVVSSMLNLAGVDGSIDSVASFPISFANTSIKYALANVDSGAAMRLILEGISYNIKQRLEKIKMNTRLLETSGQAKEQGFYKIYGQIVEDEVSSIVGVLQERLQGIEIDAGHSMNDEEKYSDK